MVLYIAYVTVWFVNLCAMYSFPKKSRPKWPNFGVLRDETVEYNIQFCIAAHLQAKYKLVFTW